MYQLLSILELASILCLVSLAAVLTFRLAGFPDLSVDGVFALGSVVFARCLLSGMGIPQAVLVAMMAGAIAGTFTSVISVRFKIHPLLASVLVLTVLYSVNLRILGRANQPIYRFESPSWLYGPYSFVFFFLFAAITITVLYILLRTEFGCGLRCTGTSPHFLGSIGRNASFYTIVLVAFAGLLVATSGCFLTIRYGFADITIGTGIIIIGIASMITGEKILGRTSLRSQVLAAPVGILLYQLAVGVALSAGVSPTDVKLTTGIITIALLSLGQTQRDKLFVQNS